eukprot:TRINITY_DN80715_c0_g1_i1.p1 TRINITY_DN80715_c0_g1~~TRINITY_DN80715_c0_g1_i1.p1  ORF type:complete len:631 (-),score=131.83 TRINITY_DN80715_c0_g1_i1:103-1995(-)
MAAPNKTAAASRPSLLTQTVTRLAPQTRVSVVAAPASSMTTATISGPRRTSATGVTVVSSSPVIGTLQAPKTVASPLVTVAASPVLKAVASPLMQAVPSARGSPVLTVAASPSLKPVSAVTASSPVLRAVRSPSLLVQQPGSVVMVSSPQLQARSPVLRPVPATGSTTAVTMVRSSVLTTTRLSVHGASGASPVQQVVRTVARQVPAAAEEDFELLLPPPVVGLDEGSVSLPSRAVRREEDAKEFSDSEDGSDLDADENDMSKDEKMVLSPRGTHWVSASRRFSLDQHYSIWFEARQGKQSKREAKSEQQYEEGLQCVGTFNSVQDFWRYWNAIDAKKMANFCSLSVFKDGIKPMWEDAGNAGGGQWILRCPDRDRALDFFNKLSLALIGGYFESHDCLCGVVLSTKPKMTSLGLWNKKVDPSLLVPVDHEIRELLGIANDKDFEVEYKAHSGAKLNNQIKRGEVEATPAATAAVASATVKPTTTSVVLTQAVTSLGRPSSMAVKAGPATTILRPATVEAPKAQAKWAGGSSGGAWSKTRTSSGNGYQYVQNADGSYSAYTGDGHAYSGGSPVMKPSIKTATTTASSVTGSSTVKTVGSSSGSTVVTTVTKGGLSANAAVFMPGAKVSAP